MSWYFRQYGFYIFYCRPIFKNPAQLFFDNSIVTQLFFILGFADAYCTVLYYIYTILYTVYGLFFHSKHLFLEIFYVLKHTLMSSSILRKRRTTQEVIL